MTNLIGISGKKQHGKDAIAKIIQYHTSKLPFDVTVSELLDESCAWLWDSENMIWKNKKYAGKLKDIVCLLTGCNREELENNDFKEEVLGEEWWVYKVKDTTRNNGLKLIPYVNHEGQYADERLVKMTRRILLELLGTECGRDIVHPNLWVNSLFADYKATIEFTGEVSEPVYPNWIITDVRFGNEVDAIKQRGGIVIRVDRPEFITTRKLMMITAKDSSKNILLPHIEHRSETALDGYEYFDYIITNDGDLKDLEQKVLRMMDNLKIPYNK